MKKNNSLVLREDVAVKYSLKLHSFTPTYPTQSDFLFDCVNYYLTITKKAQINLDQIEISKQDLKTIFSEKLSDPEFVQQLKVIIRQMIDLGKLVKKDEDILIISLNSLSEIYKIV